MSHDIWSIVIIVSLICWITSTMFFIFKVFPGKDRFEIKAAKIWGVCVLFSFAFWVTGLLNA